MRGVCRTEGCEGAHHAKGLCQRCYTREYRRQWRKDNPEAARAAYRKFEDRHREKRKAAKREKHAANPELGHERGRKWREKNATHIAEKNRRYHAENRERLLERMRKFREENPEYFSRWRKENPERGRAGASKRRALKLAAFVEDVSHEAVFERDQWRCQLCGGETSGEWPDPLSASLDHIMPLSKGGEHSYANTQCAHLRCNIQKGCSDYQVAA